MKITLSLIALNVLIFFLSFTSLDYYLNNFAFTMNNFLAGNYHTALTTMFLHADLIHLGWNMFALLLLGWVLEKKVKSWQYLLVYFVSGAVGSLSLFIPIFNYSPDTVAIGASGAISGLVGLGIFMCPGRLVIFPSFLPLPFALAGAIYFLSTLSNLFAPGYVAYSVHLFGFLFGALFGFSWGEDRIKRLVIFIALLVLIVSLPTILLIIMNLLFR